MPERDHLIQLAQAGEGAPAAGEHGETHASTGHAGGHKEHKLGDIPAPELLFANACLTAGLMIIFGIAATRKLAAIPSKAWSAQNFGEFITESFVNFTRGIIGPGGEKYVPFVGTLFIFCYLNNVIGLIPGFHSPSANLSTTLAIGLVVFFYVQFIGIRNRGLGGYIKHFAGPIPAASILLFPIEVISEIVKPFTLAMRNFGNIFGEDTVIIVLASLSVTLIPAFPALPVQFPILVLGMLTTFVQALVFSLLTCIYISLQSHHDDDHAEPGHEPATAGAHH